MAYNELIKNFSRIRDYMKEFYVYGFKSRGDFTQKSARSYDDEKRRVESWLGDYMSFRHTQDGKNVFLSIDSRAADSNPLYTAWKTKSFTDGDITLHFILFDILYDPSVKLSLKEILDKIDREYLVEFEEPLEFDESTVRKKLKEYEAEGLIRTEKAGRQMLYSRSEMMDLSGTEDFLDFFSETAPLGVIGSFMKGRLPEHKSTFSYKHHYINAALDSEILLSLLTAIKEKRTIILENQSRRFTKITTVEVVPLKILAGTQDGRWFVMSLHLKGNQINAYRLDYLKSVKLGEPYEKYDTIAPYLISLPLGIKSDDGNYWKYDVLSEPKTKVKRNNDSDSDISSDSDSDFDTDSDSDNEKNYDSDKTTVNRNDPQPDTPVYQYSENNTPISFFNIEKVKTGVVTNVMLLFAILFLSSLIIALTVRRKKSDDKDKRDN